MSITTAQVSSADGTYLSELSELPATGIWTKYWPGLCKDCSYGEGGKKKVPITINGQTFSKGLGVHPLHNGEVVVTYMLHKKYSGLQFYPGISDEVKDDWAEWSRFSADGRSEGLERPGGTFNSPETETHVKSGSSASVFLKGDGKIIGEVIYVTGRTPAKLHKLNVTGIDRLEVHLSAWGLEPCVAPYHKSGPYPNLSPQTRHGLRRSHCACRFFVDQRSPVKPVISGWC